MSRHTPLLLLFLVFAFATTTSAMWLAQSSSQKASTELTEQHQSSVGAIALHNIAPFLISDNRLAIQTELDILVAETDLIYASVFGPGTQLIAASGQKLAGDRTTTNTPIEITGEPAGMLQLQFEESLLETRSSYGQSLIIALAASVFLCLLLFLVLLRENRKLNTLSEHLNLLLNYQPESSNAFNKLNESIWFLNQQLGVDHAEQEEEENKPDHGDTSTEKHLIALISTIQLSEWQRHLSRIEFDSALKHYEERLRRMLELYRGEILVIDDHRIAIDFGSPSPRQVRQAIVFLAGSIQSLASYASPVQNTPIPMTAGLITLPSESGILSFMHCNHKKLESISEDIQRLAAGELLVDSSLMEDSLYQVIDSASTTPAGALIETIKPSVLKLWENQHHQRK